MFSERQRSDGKKYVSEFSLVAFSPMWKHATCAYNVTMWKSIMANYRENRVYTSQRRAAKSELISSSDKDSQVLYAQNTVHGHGVNVNARGLEIANTKTINRSKNNVETTIR